MRGRRKLLSLQIKMAENNNKTEEHGSKARPFDIILATGFGAGYWPWGPGTAGAVVATIIWCIYNHIINDYNITLGLTFFLALAFTLLSIKPIDRLERHWGEDPKKVVVDEMVGVWITLLAVPASGEWYYILLALVLFRIMDITKPLGCRWLDKNIHGGWGVMLDDILAGIYGAIVLYLIRI